MSQDFHEVEFPVALSFGVTGGPERRNEIVALSSGHEKRNARTAHSRRRYDAGTALRSVDDLYAVIAFFEARRGSLYGFRLRDPFDMKSTGPLQAVSAIDQAIGTGNGITAAFQLTKSYGPAGDPYVRDIRKPRPGTVRVAVNGVEKSTVQFAVDHTTGVVTLASGHVPAPGATVTAGYEFDVPVRFDTDHISVGLESFKAGQIPSIPIVELRR